jgi:hypothetical protein
MKNGVGRKGTREDFRISIFDFRLEVLERREDYIRFFFSEGAGLAGMWIEAGDSDARIC